MWARLIGALIIFGLLAFLIGGAMYSLSQINQRLAEKGVIKSPFYNFREVIEGAIKTLVHWLTIGTTTMITITLAIMVVKAVIAARRLLGIIPFRDLQRHLLILGATGSGKTNTAKRAIAMAVKNRVRTVVIDWKGEYVDFVENATIIRKINPWDIGGRSPKEKAVLAVEILRDTTRDIADVSSASATLLLRELVKLYERGTPKTSDVVNALETFFKHAMAERRLAEANMAAALLRRLLWLQIDEERPAENIIRSDQVIIYDLSKTGSAYLKTIYGMTILLRAYYDVLKHGLANELRQLLVVEECQNYVRGRRFDEPPSIGERVVNELRGHGVGVILISPDPVQIPWHLARDVAAIISIGLQAIPDFFRDIFGRYDRRELRRIIGGKKTYIYRNGKLHAARIPKPPKPIKLRHIPPLPIKEEPKKTPENSRKLIIEDIKRLVAKIRAM